MKRGYLLRKEPIDEIAVIVGVWATFEDAARAAQEELSWELDNDASDQWWGMKGPNDFSDYVIELVDIHAPEG